SLPCSECKRTLPPPLAGEGWGGGTSTASNLALLRCFGLFQRSNTQTLVHDRAGRRVLQMHLLARLEVLLDGERSERRFVKARQDQLLLARVGVDVADREDAGNIRLELGSVDDDLLLVQLEAPFCNRAQLRMQTEEHEQLIELNPPHDTVGTKHAHRLQHTVDG